MNDVKEAADRLSEGWQKYVNAFGEPPHGTVRQMAGLLSFAGLFPADSDEPITAEWLREMGGEDFDIIGGLWRFSNQYGMEFFWWSEGTVNFGDVDAQMPCTTRGQLRNLMAALGIQPTSKETTT